MIIYRLRLTANQDVVISPPKLLLNTLKSWSQIRRHSSVRRWETWTLWRTDWVFQDNPNLYVHSQWPKKKKNIWFVRTKINSSDSLDLSIHVLLTKAPARDQVLGDISCHKSLPAFMQICLSKKSSLSHLMPLTTNKVSAICFHTRKIRFGFSDEINPVHINPNLLLLPGDTSRWNYKKKNFVN